MMFQNLMKKEIKIYRLVFLFFPLLGCVYMVSQPACADEKHLAYRS